ncbi:isochorismatase family protein [Streptomyces sp. NPDC008163]|uniref:isochorismatase family protein n=1 Tax=Streptomyces sp. NPDC008163 TaxID=3364818 RepID=UPI0036ED554D
MTATVLDPTTALIVVDLQKGITALPTAHPSAGVIANAATLADSFRAKGLPVILVRVTGGAPGRTEGPARSGQPAADWAEIVPEMGPAEGDIIVTKQQWGAFYGTDLDLQLRRRGVTQVVLAGIATSIGVESTARSAHEHGYHVTLATDAMTDMSGEAHDNSVQRVFPRLGETGTTDEIVKLLG